MNKRFRRIAATVAPGCLSILLLFATAGGALSQQPKPGPPAGRGIDMHVTERLVDASISDDPAVDKMLEAYSPKVRALDNVIGTLSGELRKTGIGGGSLGNFVTDGMRASAALKLGKPIDLAITNTGGLRKNLSEGELKERDVFELMPFENALVTMELTGEQVMILLGSVAAGGEAQSGARITYVIKADKSSQLETAKLLDEKGRERKIDPAVTYTILTIDYLINRGGEKYKELREGKNSRPLGVTLRDAILNYVKSETAAGRAIKANLDGRFVLDKANSVISGETPLR